MFVAGFSVVFITLGAAASAIGELAGRHMTLLNRIAGLVIILFGLHLLGITPIRAFYADRRLSAVSAHDGATRAFVLGFAFAFGWTPCVGPILAAILALAASAANWQRGTGLLAVYAAGLAVPFLLTAVGIDRFLAAYARSRQHLCKIEVVGGCLLILIGTLVFTRHLTLVNSWLNNLPFVQTMAEHFL
jgi:cytochrome c-type biogenesis protein